MAENMPDDTANSTATSSWTPVDVPHWVESVSMATPKYVDTSGAPEFHE